MKNQEQKKAFATQRLAEIIPKSPDDVNKKREHAENQFLADLDQSHHANKKAKHDHSPVSSPTSPTSIAVDLRESSAEEESEEEQLMRMLERTQAQIAQVKVRFDDSISLVWSN